jgi:hypothetical protein
MKLDYPTLVVALALSQSALAIDAGDRSPADKNPQCMDRTTDSSTGDCIIKDEGTPRQKYPPKPQTKPAKATGAKSGATK